MKMNAVQASKQVMQELTRRESGKADVEGNDERTVRSILPGYWRWHADKGSQSQHGKPQR
jgi:hypothetical protein